MVKPDVLLLTNELDVGSDLVVRVLRERQVAFLRINTERMSERSFTWFDGSFTVKTPRGVMELDDVQAVWLRQPVWPTFDGSIAETEVLQNQWRAAVRGLAALGAPWMNPVDAGLAAESKILQLATAARVGLDVPATCVTNDLDRIRGFAEAHQGRVVVKAIDAPLIEDGATSRFVFTSRLDLAMLAGRDNPEVVPMIFQEEIANKRDVRILVVDDEAFAFAIDADPREVDWRRFGREAVVTHIAAPPEVISNCQSFLAALGLRYGAFDFAVSADGFAFLECNQNGEWGWLERATGAPVAETIASALTRSQISAGRP